jgi:hypothetical protein
MAWRQARRVSLSSSSHCRRRATKMSSPWATAHALTGQSIAKIGRTFVLTELLSQRRPQRPGLAIRVVESSLHHDKL